MTSAVCKSVMLAAGMLLLGCGGAHKKNVVAESAARRPLSLLLTDELSGKMLGKTLKEPFGLAVDHRGVLYIVDKGNNRIIRYDAELGLQREIGGPGSEPGLFDQPSFLVVDNDLSLLVSDAGNRRLVRHDSKLNYVDEILLVDDDDILKYGRASGVAVSEHGEVWMSDRQNNRVAVFDNVGRFDRFVGDFGYSGGQLSSPEKILRDGDRYIVCDAGNRRIVFYDDFGNLTGEFIDDSFVYPISIAVDKAHRYWILDNHSGQVFCFTEAGEKILSSGPLLPGANRALSGPSDIIALPNGRIAISDTGNDRVLIVTVIIEEQ